MGGRPQCNSGQLMSRYVIVRGAITRLTLIQRGATGALRDFLDLCLKSLNPPVAYRGNRSTIGAWQRAPPNRRHGYMYRAQHPYQRVRATARSRQHSIFRFRSKVWTLWSATREP